MSLQVAIWTDFGRFVHRLGLHFGFPRHMFFLILCPFWLQNSSEIVTTRLSERRTQIYGNAEIKIKKDMKILAPTFFQIARFLSLRPVTVDPATKRRGTKLGGGGDSPHGDFNKIRHGRHRDLPQKLDHFMTPRNKMKGLREAEPLLKTKPQKKRKSV